MTPLQGSSLLVTGGTGSFGRAFVPMALARFNPRRLVIYSRDELKQREMAKCQPWLGPRAAEYL